jgi:hypothetical protein
VLKGFHRCQGLKRVSQAPGWFLHQLVEQHVALTGCHLIFTDRGDTRVIVDMPTSLTPAQGCIVAIVDTARVVAKGIQLVYRASGFVTGKVA